MMRRVAFAMVKASLKRHAWLVFALVAAGVTASMLVAAVLQWLADHTDEAAQWAMASGGFALVSFAGLELYREQRSSETRRKVALVRAKPIALLARRQLDAGIRESQGAHLNHWIVDWYKSAKGEPPIDILEQRLTEVIDRVAEAGPDEVRAADWAFEAFVNAADKMNRLNAEFGVKGMTPEDLRKYIPQGREIVAWLLTAASELEALARRGADEPDLPTVVRFALDDGDEATDVAHA